MANSTTAPELVNAYNLIKAGKRHTAGRVLKSYLAKCPRDADAWWLMAHAVNQPENIRKCLEYVVRLDPEHLPARERLAQLVPPPPPVHTTSGAVPETETDDTLPMLRTWSAPRSTPTAYIPPEPSVPEVVQSETTPTRSYIAWHPATVPEAPGRPKPATNTLPATNRAAFNPAEDYADAVSNPFASSIRSAGDTLTKIATPDAVPESTASDRPIGDRVENQGEASLSPKILPFVSDPEDDTPAPRSQNMLESVIGVVVLAIALVVLVGMSLFVANRKGWIQLGQPSPTPPMTALNTGSFTIKYPKDWDVQCRTDPSGYPVCGIANHPFYNVVDWYGKAGEFDLGQVFAEMGQNLLSTQDLPDTQVSIVVMDVPTTSPLYDDSSWAKTKHDLVNAGWGLLSDEATTHYDRKEITINGRTAYYYSFVSEDPASQRSGFRGLDAAYDVYIPHDNGMMLWMTISVGANLNNVVPDALVQEMIQSISVASHPS